MTRLTKAIANIHEIDDLSQKETILTKLHPLPKVLSTAAYIAVVLSYGNYDLTGLLGMSLWLIFLSQLADLSFQQCIHRSKSIFLLIFCITFFNLFFDRTVLYSTGFITITSGMLTMITLLLKSAFSYMAVYLLITTTGMENICSALRQLHIPAVFVTVLLLIYRYLVLFLNQADRAFTAYSLRAPNQKGIAYQSWGSFIGLILLRTIDRAQLLYESMKLRGFRGDFPYSIENTNKTQSILFFILTLIYLILFRIFPVFEILGGIL